MSAGTPTVQVNTRGKLGGGKQTNPPTDSSKKNYTAQVVAKNEKGSVWLGPIHKQGDVTSAVVLRNEQDRTHQLCLDIDGQRPGSTTCSSPGKLQMTCGKAGHMEQEEDSCIIQAENGNINITANNGKIRFFANDIEMTTFGGEGIGNIKLFATDTISLESPKLTTSSSVYTKMCSSGDFEQAANGVYSLFASLINNVSDAVQCKPSKFGGQRERQKNNLPSSNDPGSTMGGADTTQYSEDYLNTGGWDKGADGELTAADAPSQY